MNRRELLRGSASTAMVFGSPLPFGAGVDQRVADLRLRPQARGNDVTTLAGRTLVDPSSFNKARTVILLVDGQSTNNNCVNGTGTFTNAAKIFNLSIGHKGLIFQAVEPLLSSDLLIAGGVTAGHQAMYIADLILSDLSANIDAVIIANLSIGGSWVMDHSFTGGFNTAGGSVSVGELAYRPALARRCIENVGLGDVRRIIKWRQGEWDSDNGGTTQADYTASLNGYIAETKNCGLLTASDVMIVDLCTRISETAGHRNPIRAAQAAVVDGVRVRSGSDCDTISSGSRYDGTHWTTASSATLAALDKVAIENFILNG